MGRVDFLFFEKANFPAIRPLLDAVQGKAKERPGVAKAFDYKEVTGEIPPFPIPPQYQEVLKRHPLGKRCPSPFAESVGGVVGARLWRREYWDFLRNEYPRWESALERYVKERRPAVVVIPEDTHYLQGRLAARVLRGHGVRVVVVMAIYYQAIATTPLLGERIADDYFVFDAAMAERLLLAGVAPERVHHIPCVAFSAAVDPIVAPAKSLYFALQGKPWESIIIRDLVEIFSVMPNAQLVVKTHPEVRPALPSLAAANVSVVTTGAMGDHLPTAGAVLSTSSSALFEACAAGVPVIVVDYGSLPPESTLAARPGICCVRTRAALEAAVRRAVDGAIAPWAPGRQWAASPASIAAVAETLLRWAEEAEPPR